MPSFIPLPWPAALTLRLVDAQRRTCPPRARRSVAGAIPAESCDPLTTLKPVPAGRTAVGAPGSETNSSPICVWAHTGAGKSSKAATLQKGVLPGMKLSDFPATTKRQSASILAQVPGFLGDERTGHQGLT